LATSCRALFSSRLTAEMKMSGRGVRAGRTQIALVYQA
jgi:hypothetical protein